MMMMSLKMRWVLKRTSLVLAAAVVTACPIEAAVSAVVATVASAAAGAGPDSWQRFRPRLPALGACAVHEEIECGREGEALFASLHLLPDAQKTRRRRRWYLCVLVQVETARRVPTSVVNGVNEKMECRSRHKTNARAKKKKREKVYLPSQWHVALIVAVQLTPLFFLSPCSPHYEIAILKVMLRVFFFIYKHTRSSTTILKATRNERQLWQRARIDGHFRKQIISTN